MVIKLADLLAADKIPSAGPRKKSKFKQAHESFDFIKLIQAWPSIVGNKLAQETVPLKNRYGVLTVLTRHAAFSEQVKFMEEMLKQKIYQTFPSLQGKINRINFISNPQAFVDNQVKASKIRRDPIEQKARLHPLSPEYKKRESEARQLFSEVDDKELFDYLSSLYIQIKE